MTVWNPEDEQPVPLDRVESIARGDSSDTAIRLVDLRGKTDFEGGHIPSSSRLAIDEIEIAYLRPPRSRSLILVGEERGAAVVAAARLRELGHPARPAGFTISNWPGPWEKGPERTPVWEPSPLAARWVDSIPRGGVLDLACGSGRDAVFLALHGCDVTAIDILPDAIERGRALAARHRVTVEFRVGDLEGDPDSWKGSWGVIHVHRFLHREGLTRLPGRLRPGGWLLYETFIDRQAAQGRKPRRPEHLLRSGELLRAASGLEIVEYREGETEGGDWTAALVARRRSDASG